MAWAYLFAVKVVENLKSDIVTVPRFCILKINLCLRDAAEQILDFMNKNLLTVFWVFAASLFSVQSWGQSGDFGENNALHWEFSGSFPDGTITVSGTGAMPSFQGIPPWFAYANVLSPDPSAAFPISPNDPRAYLFWSYTIIIAEGVTSIGSGAFCGMAPTSYIKDGSQGWMQIANITIPSSMTSIDDRAFYSVDGVINVPSSVTKIGFTPYISRGFNVANDNPTYSSEGGVLFNKDKSILYSSPSML